MRASMAKFAGVLPSLPGSVPVDHRASSPLRTRDVFSFIPVSFDALSTSESSIFNVVLIFAP
jgi:hypothetical protein